MLVSKDSFGGSPKITLQNKNDPQGYKLFYDLKNFSGNGITDRENIFELVLHFVADTDAAEIILELIFRSRCRCCFFLQL